MPSAGNTRAGELNRVAEHAHEKAAVSHEQGEHRTAHELSREAMERTRETEARLAAMKQEGGDKK